MFPVQKLIQQTKSVQSHSFAPDEIADVSELTISRQNNVLVTL